MEFKRIMTFDQMRQHLLEHSCLNANRVTVGRYARKNGFSPYKAMSGGRMYFSYVNEKIPATKEDGAHEE